MAKLYSFIVQGKGAFPVDMLRYDQCWPATSAAVLDLDYSMNDDSPRRVAVTGVCEPTVARWRSFGWTVASVTRR